MYLITRYLIVLGVGLMLIQGYAAYHTVLNARDTLERTSTLLAMGSIANGGDHTTYVYDSLSPSAGGAN